MKQTYNYIETYYPAQPRSEYLKKTSQTGGSSILVSGGSGTGTVTSDFDIFQGEGISIYKNTEDRLAYTISHGSTSDAASTTNESTFVLKNIEIDQFGHVTGFESGNVTEDLDQRYLRKDIDDTAHGNILFDKKIGSSVFTEGYAGRGWEITNIGAATLDSVRSRSDIFLAGKFGSPSFASGFTGHGVEIDMPTASGTVDHWTVRKSMKVYELVYSQIYGLGGSVIVSDLNKILKVEQNITFYRCYLDTMDGQMRMNLRKDDIVRMQRSSGVNIRYFYGEVINVTSLYFDLRIIDGEDYPEAGDVVFRFGNKSDLNRQGILYLTSSDDKAPYIDVLDGITDSSMEEKIKVRLGNLSGIRTKSGSVLNTYGLYAKGAYFEDTEIFLEDGMSVSQKFSVMNGIFDSTIEGVRNEMSLEPGNILKNSSFGTNLHYWKSENDILILSPENTPLWIIDNYYSEKKKVADMFQDGIKKVLRIRNTRIYQSNDVMNLVDETPINGEATGGSSTDDPENSDSIHSFSFLYKVIRPGTLSVGFKGQDLYMEKELKETSEEFLKIAETGKWDRTGDFEIKFTGEILIYGVSLFNDALANSEIRLSTQIFQNAEQIALRATKEYVDLQNDLIYRKYDAELSVKAQEIAMRVTEAHLNDVTQQLETKFTSSLSVQANRISAISQDLSNLWSAGWITTSQGNQLWAQKDVENLKNGEYLIKSVINQTPERIKISAKNIDFEGSVVFSEFNEKLDNKIDGKFSGSGNNYSLQINGKTIIDGGHIITDLIDVNKLYVTKLAANEGIIGGFKLDNGNLTWQQSNYFGNGSRLIKLGCANSQDGAVDVSFDASTSGAFGIKTVGSAPGGAAIYASSHSSQTYPKYGMTYAGYFDGNVDTNGELISNVCASQEYRAISERLSNGTYRYYTGISFNSNYDLDDVRFTVRNGLIVALHKDNGEIIIQG